MLNFNLWTLSSILALALIAHGALAAQPTWFVTEGYTPKQVSKYTRLFRETVTLPQEGYTQVEEMADIVNDFLVTERYHFGKPYIPFTVDARTARESVYEIFIEEITFARKIHKKSKNGHTGLRYAFDTRNSFHSPMAPYPRRINETTVFYYPAFTSKPSTLTRDQLKDASRILVMSIIRSLSAIYNAKMIPESISGCSTNTGRFLIYSQCFSDTDYETDDGLDLDYDNLFYAWLASNLGKEPGFPEFENALGHEDMGKVTKFLRGYLLKDLSSNQIDEVKWVVDALHIAMCFEERDKSPQCRFGFLSLALRLASFNPDSGITHVRPNLTNKQFSIDHMLSPVEKE